MSAKTQWPEQLSRAVRSDPGQSHVIIGAAGSGKTTLLIERAHYLVTEAGLHPDQVRLLTPSRAGATRLRDDVAARIPRATKGPWAKSVASLAFSVVTADNLARGLPAPTLRSGADIDEDIRALFDDVDGAHNAFSGVFDPIVTGTETFRTELRELMARVIEHGHTPAELVSWGEKYDRVPWQRAGQFMADYQRVIARSRPNSFEPAELITRAARIIGEALPDELSDLRVVLVDDSHDIPASARTLIAELARWGVSVTAVGDPDVAGQTFRGSDPGSPAALADMLGVAPIFSTRVFRHGPGIRSRVSVLSQRVGTARAGQQRAVEAVGPEASVPVIRLEASSATDEDFLIARYIDDHRRQHRTPLDQIAVISRRATSLEGIARALGHRDIRSHRSTRAALSTEPAVRELSWWALAALRPTAVTPDRAMDMLTGMFGGWSALELRLLVTWIRVREAAESSPKSAPDVIAEFVRGSDILIDAPDSLIRRIERTRSIVLAIRKVGAEAPIDVVLSAAWQAVSVEKAWLDRHGGGGEGARFVSRALDAVIALTETAARFAQAHPGVAADVFIHRVLSQDVAEDVLVPEPLSKAVWLGTPSGAAGRQWSVVILHGLNDGVWPNTAVRGSLLGAPEIAWLARGVDPGDIDQRKVVLDDEIRMATLAASRAARQLVVSAVSADDTSPSPLFYLLADGALAWEEGSEHPDDPRALVSSLRRALSHAEHPDHAAVPTLAYLASRKVFGAHPEHWWGLMGSSTTQPLFADDIVRLSPTRVSQVEQSPLMWLLDTIAPEPLPPAVDVGRIVHGALEANPWGPAGPMREYVDHRWSDINFDSAWLSEAKRAETHRHIDALDSYLVDQRRDNIELVASEKKFEIELPGALMTGFIDRLVRDKDGNLLVVDLKTGRHKTDNQVVDDPQLLAYQLAITTPGVTDGWGVSGGETGGAYLLFVSAGKGGKPYRIALQAPLDSEGQTVFLERLDAVREIIASYQFAVGEVDSRSGGRTPRHRWHLIEQVCGD